jgi:hypothetical protein
MHFSLCVLTYSDDLLLNQLSSDALSDQLILIDLDDLSLDKSSNDFFVDVPSEVLALNLPFEYGSRFPIHHIHHDLIHSHPQLSSFPSSSLSFKGPSLCLHCGCPPACQSIRYRLLKVCYD